MPLEPSDASDELPTDRPLPAYLRIVKNGGASTMLGAAMIAVGEIFEPEKASVEMVMPGNDEPGDDPFDLDFGDLPPLG